MVILSLDLIVPCSEYQTFKETNKKRKPSFQLYFHRKCGFMWNRYRVQKIGQLNTHSSYSLSHKQLTPLLSQKMWPFVENVPGTAILSQNLIIICSKYQTIERSQKNPTKLNLYLLASSSWLTFTRRRLKPYRWDSHPIYVKAT